MLLAKFDTFSRNVISGLVLCLVLTFSWARKFVEHFRCSCYIKFCTGNFTFQVKNSSGNRTILSMPSKLFSKILTWRNVLIERILIFQFLPDLASPVRILLSCRRPFQFIFQPQVPVWVSRFQIDFLLKRCLQTQHQRRYRRSSCAFLWLNLGFNTAAPTFTSMTSQRRTSY